MAGRGTNSIQSFNRQQIKEIQKALKGLPKEFSKRRKQTILKKGLEPFINAAISKAPKDTGDLKLSIGTKTFRNNTNGVFGGVVTKKKIKIGGSVGTETVDAFYAKFIEYGYRQIAWPTKGETLRKSYISKGRVQKIAPRPFLRPAWDATKGQVKTVTIAVAEKRIKAYMKKINKS